MLQNWSESCRENGLFLLTFNSAHQGSEAVFLPANVPILFPARWQTISSLWVTEASVSSVLYPLFNRGVSLWLLKVTGFCYRAPISAEIPGGLSRRRRSFLLSSRTADASITNCIWYGNLVRPDFTWAARTFTGYWGKGWTHFKTHCHTVLKRSVFPRRCMFTLICLDKTDAALWSLNQNLKWRLLPRSLWVTLLACYLKRNLVCLGHLYILAVSTSTIL